MITTKKVVCIIPARLASSRFPRKMLANLLNKPILQWVWEAATSVEVFQEVIFAVDSEETAALIETFNGKYLMTSVDCKSGTDRLVEVMKSGKVTGDIWVNWQGDEPFIKEAMIKTLLQSCDTDTNTDMWTLKKRITVPEQITAPNFAKVVCDATGHALYFSRSPIPFYREDSTQIPFEKKEYYKHVGIYAFTTQALKKIKEMSGSYLEDAEKLEQLRFLQHGFKIKVHESDQDVKGIDTPQDLAQAEEIAKKLMLIFK